MVVFTVPNNHHIPSGLAGSRRRFTGPLKQSLLPFPSGLIRCGQGS